MISALFSLLLLADPSTSAASVPAETAQTQPSAEAKKEKKICRVDEEYTGSRLAKRICLTKSQWEERKRSEGRD